MIIENDIQLDFDDVLIAPQTTTINHRGEVDIVRDFKCGLTCVPIMSANMTQTGVFAVAKELLKADMCATLHKFYTAREIADFINKNKDLLFEKYENLFITVGKRNWEKEIKKLVEVIKLTKRPCFSILLDVPNAYIPEITDCVKELRTRFPDQVIAVGNVCTGDEVQKLILAGANFVKVGIGPSKVCDTRIKTKCGRSQLSACIDCANAAHQVGGGIILDGGFKTIGDFCAAFVAGADICMSGSMFCGCDEAHGEVITKCYKTNEYELETLMVGYEQCDIPCKPVYEYKKFKEYYGMSSFRAQKENYGKTTTTGTSEGVESMLVPYTGPIINTINDICGSLRSCGSYIGAKKIKHFNRQGKFYRVNRIK